MEMVQEAQVEQEQKVEQEVKAEQLAEVSAVPFGLSPSQIENYASNKLSLKTTRYYR